MTMNKPMPRWVQWAGGLCLLAVSLTAGTMDPFGT